MKNQKTIIRGNKNYFYGLMLVFAVKIRASNHRNSFSMEKTAADKSFFGLSIQIVFSIRSHLIKLD